MLQEILELYAFHRWANQRILAAASALSPEELTRDLRSSFPSVLATLGHLLGADWIWLQRWKGGSPTSGPESWDLSTAEALVGRWAEVEQEQAAFLRGLAEADLHRVLRYRMLSGVAQESPLWQTLRHVVNHATYHRGQVVTLLRQLGASAPGTDLIAFYRENSSAPSIEAVAPPMTG
jgi:uncharacterized damage-inducible protein DinB